MPERTRTFKLGRYEVLGRIATGGMATVYRARLSGQGGFQREVALKVIHPHLSDAEGFTERFLDEARVASRVRHPNVVATIDNGEDRGYRYLALELVDGVTLRELCTHLGHPIPPPEAARLVADGARGLHAVHTVADETGDALDVIHRDLSPHNLMVDHTGRAVLIDLGLAKARGQLGHTQTGVLAGKLPYMSPEQSRLDTLDGRSDVFSLGTVLFELVTGELPFGDQHTPDTLARIRACDHAELSTRMSEATVPAWMCDVILTCLREDPDARFPSALALAEALEDELRNAGYSETDTRRRLSTHARQAREALGPDAPVEPLPARISGDPMRPTPRYGWLVATVASVGAVAFFLWFDFGSAASSVTEGAPGTLNADLLEAERAPQAAPEVAPAPPEPVRSRAAEESEDLPPDLPPEPAEPPRKRGRAKDKADTPLKSNPYRQ